MIEIIYVQLRGEGKIVPYNPRGLDLKIADEVIIEVDRGVDYGYIASDVEVVNKVETDGILKSVIRKLNEKDYKKIKQNEKKAREALNRCREKVEEHNLPMKLVKAEYSFDLSKIIFFFTAEGRVDFRNLVKDLASLFKVRIELRQIGVRDEAKMMGGCGHCGRTLCCVSFLRNFEPVTIKMAKDQRLSLNPTKISGLCGRLMCCLEYENSTYKELLKNLPSEGKKLQTPDGIARVVSVNILQRSVMVMLDDGTVKEISFKECNCPSKNCPVHSKIKLLNKK